MTVVFSRILLRYLAGALVAYGLFPADLADQFVNDPEVINYTVLAIGAGIAALTEGAYLLAKRFGWAT